MISGGLSKKVITLIVFSYLVAFLSFSVILFYVKVPAYKEVSVTGVSTPVSNSFFVALVNKKDILEANSIYFLINKQPINIQLAIQPNSSANSISYILTIPGKTLQTRYIKGMNFYIYQQVTLISKLKLAILKRYD